MIERLVELDEELFALLNGRLHTPVLDRLMVAVTTERNWLPVLAGLWLALVVWGGRRGRMAAAMVVLAVALSDQLTCSVVKPLVGRVRPANALPAGAVRLLAGKSAALSFPSAHAANNFAAAAVLAWRWPRFAVLAFALAALVAYSRIYVGAHFPGDALAGGVLGLLCGRGAIWVVAASVRTFERSRALPARAGSSPAPRPAPPEDSASSGSSRGS